MLNDEVLTINVLEDLLKFKASSEFNSNHFGFAWVKIYSEAV